MSDHSQNGHHSSGSARNSVQISVTNGGGPGSIHDPLLYDDNPMSKDRRKFVIICVFDFVLITILWLLSTVTKGDNWPEIFLTEINIFEADFLQVSLFDIVIMAGVRTLILLIFFAGFRVEHWLPVAFTTSVTTIFVIIKILFFFKKNHGGLPQLVILASVSISWFELWIVPFRVLRGERRAQDTLIPVESAHVATSGSAQRSSSIGRTLFRRNRRFNARRRLVGNLTEDDFRTAQEYTTDEERNPEAPASPTINLPGYGLIDRRSAMDTLDDAYRQLLNLGNQIPTWKVMNKVPEVRNHENTYYVRHEFDCEPRVLFLASWRDNELWNPQVLRMDYLVRIDGERDIVHSESSPALGGYIASRHFIDIRRVIHDAQAQSYTCVYVSIPTPSKPEGDAIRGLNGPNLVRITKSEQTGKSVFEWIMNTDVKSQIPRALMRRGTVTFLSSYPGLLGRFINEKWEFYTQVA